MIERTEACFCIKPEWIVADTAYGSASNLNWLVNQQGIAPLVPVIDKSKRDDGTFNREDFTFDQERNVYICPAGKILTTTGRLVNDGETLCFTSRAYSTAELPVQGAMLSKGACSQDPAAPKRRRYLRSQSARFNARAFARVSALVNARLLGLREPLKPA